MLKFDAISESEVEKIAQPANPTILSDFKPLGCPKIINSYILITVNDKIILIPPSNNIAT